MNFNNILFFLKHFSVKKQIIKNRKTKWRSILKITSKKTINFEDFLKIDMRVGTILEVSLNQKARKPAYVLKIDFGLEIGIKQSSAQITNYSEEELINKKIIAVCNFEKKNIAGIESEVLILGSINKMNEVLLLSASNDAKNGDYVA